MSTQSKCSRCEPPGSGHCKDCKTNANSGSAKCRTCYGTGKCRHCHGLGVEMSTLEKATSILVGVWWISWFGIITGFIGVGVWEYRNIPPKRSAHSRFSLSLLMITILLWVVFYVMGEKARAKVAGAKNEQVIVNLLTMAGTFLAIVTIMGILFFTYVAPRVQ
jgi:hypothetical protein